MNIIDIAYALTAPVEAVMFFMMMDGFFERRKQFPIWQYAIGIAILTVSIRIVNDYLLFRVGNAIGMILASILISVYFYRVSWLKRVFVMFFSWALLIGIFEVLILNVICLVFGITANECLSTPAYVVLGIIVSKFLGLAVGYALCTKSKLKEIELDKGYWFLFILLFTSATITTFLILGMLSELDDTDYNIMVMISCIGLFSGTFFALYLYARSQQQNQIIRYQEQAEQQMRSQIKHMDELVLKQNELRALRHDMNGHLIALKRYFDTRDYESGRHYIETLGEQFQQTTPFLNTGNNALDAILSAKHSLAESKGIAFHTSITIQKDLPIAPEDCSVIFGNALDNAIEACDRLPADAEKSINLFLQQDATSILCKITNTAPPNTEKTFLTSKADKVNHGFGMKNIKEALEKYPSLYNFKQQENQFEFSFSVFY